MKKVLIIDDSTPVRILCDMVLKSSGFETMLAADAPEAVATLQKSVPDLILLDINLPGLDGISFAEKIKAVAKLRNIPIIFITGAADALTLNRAKSIGPAGFIVKPIHGNMLVQKIWNILSPPKTDPVREAKPKKSRNIRKVYSTKSGLLTLTARGNELLPMDHDTVFAYADEYGGNGLTSVIIDCGAVHAVSSGFFSQCLRLQEKLKSQTKGFAIIIKHQGIIQELKQLNLFKYFNIAENLKDARLLLKKYNKPAPTEAV